MEGYKCWGPITDSYVILSLIAFPQIWIIIFAAFISQGVQKLSDVCMAPCSVLCSKYIGSLPWVPGVQNEIWGSITIPPTTSGAVQEQKVIANLKQGKQRLTMSKDNKFEGLTGFYLQFIIGRHFILQNRMNVCIGVTAWLIFVRWTQGNMRMKRD